MTLPRRWFLIASVVCAAAVSLLFLPGLGGAFVFDDISNILDNPAIHLQTLDAGGLSRAAFSPQPGGITRVIPTLSFALDYWRAGGADPATFKATNLAIHALTALALAWFFRALLISAAIPQRRAQLGALTLALAWAAHPLQASSVLYVVQRMQMLSTLFLVLALWTYIGARRSQIRGLSGRTGLMLTGLLWLLAIGCKEDAVQLPAYTLALEFTVLRFAAAPQELARQLRKVYLLAVVVGTALYLLIALPHYWHWDPYPFREFNSYERLLTQGRVLAMYLGQIVFPLPANMPFYYDWLQPSRGLLRPWTTLPALLLCFALITLAWRRRGQRPLFSLGVFLFFTGHFVTSNVVNLELAFEHRNHFPLIGALLAIGDLLAQAAQRLQLTDAARMVAGSILLGLLTIATLSRAEAWGDRLTLARTSTELAPHSSRAWNSLCLSYDDLGGGRTPHNPNLDKAIAACSSGATAAPYSLTAPTNLIVLKTRRGVATPADWDLYLQRLRRVTMSPENRQAIWILIDNVRTGVKLDEAGVLDAIDIITERTPINSGEYTAIGYFILGQTGQPERAYQYFAKAMQTSQTDDSLAAETIAEMRRQGRTEWAQQLENLLHSNQPSPAGVRH